MQQSNRKHKMLLRDSDADNVVAKPLDDTGHDARIANKKPAALHYNCLKTMGCFDQKDNGKHMTTSPSPLLLAKRQAPRENLLKRRQRRQCLKSRASLTRASRAYHSRRPRGQSQECSHLSAGALNQKESLNKQAR